MMHVTCIGKQTNENEAIYKTIRKEKHSEREI
jgi:hypothetical protein